MSELEAAASPPRAWAEVSCENILHNLNVVRQFSEGCEVMAVLKAGAYGHGLEELANFLAGEDLAFFGVASVVEARRLLAAGIKKRIFLLGPTFPQERKEIVQHRWVASLSSLEEAWHFNALNTGKTPLPVHITVDTGMGRGGFLPQQLREMIAELLEFEFLQIEGIGSHLPCADEDEQFTLEQFSIFENLVNDLKKIVPFRYVHLSNSAGILGYHSDCCNLVRPGLMLYGISPFEHYQCLLKPVISLKSRVSLVRELPAGQGISYGRTHILTKQSRIATVGIGYGDGYSRHFSQVGAMVRISGILCPVLGRVTMDQIMVDVSEVTNCVAGDEVELYGAHILVSTLAEKANMIPWEILTSITPRVKRVYLDQF